MKRDLMSKKFFNLTRKDVRLCNGDTSNKSPLFLISTCFTKIDWNQTESWDEFCGHLGFGMWPVSGKLPDNKFLLTTPESSTPRFAALKFISACKTWYPPGQKVKGTEKRAGKLEYECTKVLRDYDVRFHGATAWQ